MEPIEKLKTFDNITSNICNEYHKIQMMKEDIDDDCTPTNEMMTNPKYQKLIEREKELCPQVKAIENIRKDLENYYKILLMVR